MPVQLTEAQRADLEAAKRMIAQEEAAERADTKGPETPADVLARIREQDEAFSQRIDEAMVDLPIDEHHEVMSTVQEIESNLSLMKEFQRDGTKKQQRIQLSKDLNLLQERLREKIVSHTRTLLQRPRFQKIRQDYHVMWSHRDEGKRRRFLHELMTQEFFGKKPEERGGLLSQGLFEAAVDTVAPRLYEIIEGKTAR